MGFHLVYWMKRLLAICFLSSSLLLAEEETIPAEEFEVGTTAQTASESAKTRSYIIGISAVVVTAVVGILVFAFTSNGSSSHS